MESLQGQLLIASPKLLDPNFARSIVLIVQHGEEGALGLVLNRPLEMTVRQACAEALDTECSVEEPLYLGGPCQGPLMVLHTDPTMADLDVLPGLYFAVEKDKLEQLLMNEELQGRFFIGHSGWAAGQLEGEMETGSWLTTAADQELVLEASDGTWSRLMQRITLGRWVDPDRIPEDPSVN
jgi:putative transcriptional regulator